MGNKATSTPPLLRHVHIAWQYCSEHRGNWVQDVVEKSRRRVWRGIS